MDYFSFFQIGSNLYWFFHSGEDDSVLNKGVIDLSNIDGSDELHLFDDYYFSFKNFIYKKVEDDDGNVKKLAVMYCYANSNFLLFKYEDIENIDDKGV